MLDMLFWFCLLIYPTAPTHDLSQSLRCLPAHVAMYVFVAPAATHVPVAKAALPYVFLAQAATYVPVALATLPYAFVAPATTNVPVAGRDVRARGQGRAAVRVRGTGCNVRVCGPGRNARGRPRHCKMKTSVRWTYARILIFIS